MYLYEAARHGNVSMMLHALALEANKNYPNPYDHQRTPLIQAVLSVTIDQYISSFIGWIWFSRDMPLQLNIF